MNPLLQKIKFELIFISNKCFFFFNFENWKLMNNNGKYVLFYILIKTFNVHQIFNDVYCYLYLLSSYLDDVTVFTF
jgi:hypothetical protein